MASRLLLALAVLTSAAPAVAQRVLVVGVATGSEAPAVSLAAQTARFGQLAYELPHALREAGVEALLADEALAALAGTLVPLPEPRPAQLRLPETCRDEVLADLQRRRRRQALTGAEQCIRLLQESGALAAVLEDDQAARAFLDLCLLEVRAVMETRGDPLPRAITCRRLVPRTEPSPDLHAPAALRVWRQAAAAEHQAGALRLRSDAPCDVRLGGRPVGATPLDLEDLAPGRYVVSFRCGEGRATAGYVVEHGVASQVVEHRGLSDAFVADVAPVLADEGGGASRLRDYALSLGRAVEADEVILVGVGASIDAAAEDIAAWLRAGTVRVDRWSVTDGALRARVRLRGSRRSGAVAGLPRLREGLERLRRGGCTDLAEEGAAPLTGEGC
jgi:hypothetical protein